MLLGFCLKFMSKTHRKRTCTRTLKHCEHIYTLTHQEETSRGYYTVDKTKLVAK